MRQTQQPSQGTTSPRHLKVNTNPTAERDDNPTTTSACCRPSNANANSTSGNPQPANRKTTPKTPSSAVHSPGAGGILRTMMLLRGGPQRGNTNAAKQPQAWRNATQHRRSSSLNSLNSESSRTVPDNESFSSSVAREEDFDFLDTIESNASFVAPETGTTQTSTNAAAAPAPLQAKSPPQQPAKHHRKSHSHDFSYYPAPPPRARTGSNMSDSIDGVILMATTTATSSSAASRNRTGSNMSDISMTYSEEGDEEQEKGTRFVGWGGGALNVQSSSSPNRSRTQSLEEFQASLAPQPAATTSSTNRARTHSDFSTRSAPVVASSPPRQRRVTTRRPSNSSNLAWMPPPPSQY